MEQKWNPWLAHRLSNTNTHSGALTLYALRPFPALRVLVEPFVSFSRLCWISVISVCARFLFMCLSFLGKVPVYRASVSLVLHSGHLMFLLHLLSWNIQLTEEKQRLLCKWLLSDQSLHLFAPHGTDVNYITFCMSLLLYKFHAVPHTLWFDLLWEPN